MGFARVAAAAVAPKATPDRTLGRAVSSRLVNASRTTHRPHEGLDLRHANVAEALRDQWTRNHGNGGRSLPEEARGQNPDGDARHSEENAIGDENGEVDRGLRHTGCVAAKQHQECCTEPGVQRRAPHRRAMTLRESVPVSKIAGDLSEPVEVDDGVDDALSPIEHKRGESGDQRTVEKYRQDDPRA
jgi:hypothetical protein